MTLKRGAFSGFTLIEMIVTVAVLGIISAIAAPAFNSIIQSSKVSASADDLLTVLQVARSEAVRRVKNVVVCPSSDGATCLAGTAWSTGAIAQVVLGNGSFEVVQVRQFSTAGIGAVGPEKITFNSVGSAAQSAVTITIGGGATKTVCLEAAGRSVIHKGSTCP